MHHSHLLRESFHIKVTVGKVDGGVGVENLDPLVLGCLGTSDIWAGPTDWEQEKMFRSSSKTAYLLELIHVVVQRRAKNMAQDCTPRTEPRGGGEELGDSRFHTGVNIPTFPQTNSF